jgi:hypothetical protein
VFILRCIACNKNLNDFESTRKSIVTGDYLDLCNSCYHSVQDELPAKERDDLRSEEETFIEDDSDDPLTSLPPLE